MQWIEIKRWQRIEKMLQCNGKRRRKQSKFSNKSNRRFIPKEVFDEFVEPTVICNGENQLQK